MRWSKLWLDPSGLGNDLDSDAITYEDFVLKGNATIHAVEWWGNTPPNQGFQVEFWRQDPGTIAYQPLAVFRESGAHPEAAFVITNVSAALDPSGSYHFSATLPTPVSLAANNSSNPRWFLAVIGLTDNAPFIWTWAQGLGGSTRSYQWIRGGGNRFYQLPEGRAMKMTGTLTGLHGQVVLGNFVGPIEGQKVTVELLSGGTVAETQTVTLDANGNFGMGSVQTGSFGVRIKSSHWLRKLAGTVTLPGGVVSCVLSNGDINGDNQIDSDDFDLLVQNFGTAHTTGDLDGSGVVDSDDFDILVWNFGSVGD